MQIQDSRKLGFTLIELIVVVAILAILAAVAIPGYRRYIDEAARSEANTLLVDIAAKQEAFYSLWGTYFTVKDGWNLSTAPNRSRSHQGIDTSEPWKQLGFDPGGPTYWWYESLGNARGYSVCAVRRLGDEYEFGLLLHSNRRNIVYQKTLPQACNAP